MVPRGKEQPEPRRVSCEAVSHGKEGGGVRIGKWIGCGVELAKGGEEMEAPVRGQRGNGEEAERGGEEMGRGGVGTG